MELSPRLYHLFVRPSLFTKIYINNVIERHFDFRNKTVLDFGSGIGSSSSMFSPGSYVGIDSDPKRIAYAKRLYPGYSFSVLEGERLPVANQSVDYILIVAVLHHIPSDQLPVYLQEFRRVLKPYGKILVMEPCFYKNSRFNNWFMASFDKGQYIRDEEGYTKIFQNHDYHVEKLNQFKKLFFYNEIFFAAAPK